MIHGKQNENENKIIHALSSHLSMTADWVNKSKKKKRKKKRRHVEAFEYDKQDTGNKSFTPYCSKFGFKINSWEIFCKHSA